jgi:hypothetical protein
MNKKPTDLQMLSCLLRLRAPEPKGRRAFQAMYDDLINGKIIRLSKKQRAWVEELFFHHKLDRRELPPKPDKPPIKDKRPQQEVILDFGPLPKKPPGRA